MTEKYKLKLSKEEVGKRVRAIIGVPEPFLSDDVISSPVFVKKTESYINNSIKEYLELIEESNGLLDVASMYYLSYLLCVGMEARLPKQMENLSTKTLLQNVSWDKKALSMLNDAEETLGLLFDEYDIDEGNLYGTFAELSSEMDYPETSV